MSGGTYGPADRDRIGVCRPVPDRIMVGTESAACAGSYFSMRVR